jgi:glycosyltransferase involved in cell wall biosynthesis
MKFVAIVIQNITYRAGTERAVCNLANILAQYGGYLPVIVSLYSSDGGAAYPLHKDIKIIHSGIASAKNKMEQIAEYAKTANMLKKIRMENNTEILMGTNVGINIPLSLVNGNNLIKIGCEHRCYDDPSVFSKFLRRLCYPKLDAVVTLVSCDAKRYSFCKNVKTIPNSFSFLPKEHSRLCSGTILLIGRYTYQKNFENIIEAMSLIKDKCVGWRVRIIGDGEDKGKLQSLIKEKRLEEIVFLVPPTDNIEEEYLNSSIFVMCSRSEGLPMVMIEAKSCGLPVVSFDCPTGPADIIRDGIDGILVGNGNIKALAEAVLKLIENQDLRKRFGQEAIKDRERFSPAKIFEMWESLFKELKKDEK